MWSLLKKSFSQTSSALSGLWGKKKTENIDWNALEELLIQADMGIKTTNFLIETLKKKTVDDSLQDDLYEILVEKTHYSERELFLNDSQKKIFLILGVNGAGKTTTLGKIAFQAKKKGFSVRMISADSFRAAASDQLLVWAERAGVDFSEIPLAKDPASIVFQGLEHAIEATNEIVLIDTAGRLPNKPDLMAELQKIDRTVQKFVQKNPSFSYEKVLILDGTTGQNSLAQMQLFDNALETTGVIVTKLDGQAKGGMIVQLIHQFKKPVLGLGMGEAIEDLYPFRAKEFMAAILDRPL